MATQVSSWASFGGKQLIYEHESAELGCKMKVAVYVPPSGDAKCNVLYYLSGLTCNEQNCIQKGAFQQHAAAANMIVVCPDTSPRGLGIEGEDLDWDFGTGAGFYVDATEPKWAKYRMYSYDTVTKELPALIKQLLGERLSGKCSITGHSMGGHGALVCALRNPGVYSSVSAFAPISAPTKCPWGEKCFGGYLGQNKESWEAYDASILAGNYNGPELAVLIDQGGDDTFLHQKQLLPEEFEAGAAKNDKVNLTYNCREGYDHSYFFIASFMANHIAFHAKHME